MVHPALTNYDPRRSGYYNKVQTLKKLGRGTSYSSPMGRLWNATKAIAYPPKYPVGYRKSRYVTGGMRGQWNGGGPSRGVNRVVNRKRYRRRRRLRYGTKVRKQALGLFEGRRSVVNQTFLTGASVTARTVGRVSLMEPLTNPTTEIATNSSETVQRTLSGTGCFLRGFKIQMLFSNESTTTPVDVRIICGWRKFFTNVDTAVDTGSSRFEIFKNSITQRAPVQLIETANGTGGGVVSTNDVYMLGKAPLSSKYFHCEKDFSFRLGPNNTTSEEVFGSNIKRLQFWWDLHNKQYKFKTAVAPGSSEATVEKAATFWPCVYFYHTTPLQPGEAAAPVNYYMSHVIYWKDPIG